ncbi:MAG: class I tRNA ligase family protein [Anaerolineae bacterium]|nr:class I tRNA ligase family protein [Anaerolineae bacterium]
MRTPPTDRRSPITVHRSPITDRRSPFTDREVLMFQPVPTKPDFIAQEHQILDFWARTDAFRKLWAMNKGKKRWSFVDGPITANGPMGVHHAWGRTYKDLYQRFYAMRGYDERFQNGFDCQGLWVEVNVERELGFKSKRDIEAFGLAEFVNLCKQRVLNFAAIQTEQSIRLGYWMDWNDPDQLRWLRDKLAEDPGQVITVQGPHGPVTDTVEQIVGRLGMPELGGSYFTFSNENNYQIWGFLKRCWEKGWLYKGTDVMPWCDRCGTGISQHEIVTDGYEEITHTSIYVRFPLLDEGGRQRLDQATGLPEALLVWTTTPWTLTSNVAAAVGPEMDYVKVQQDGWVYYLAKGTVKRALAGKFTVLGELKGKELVGWTYAGPFDDLPAVQEAFQRQGYTHTVIPWKDVGEAEGTGIVHIAPGCGAEDFALSKQLNLPVIAPLDENGVYLEGFAWLTGRNVHGVAEPIFDDLRAKGRLYRLEDYTHRYPVCWRCKTELIFRLVDEWFISMGEVYDKPRDQLTPEEVERSLRYQIMEVVDQIRWIPAFGYERELDWLRNMHDWMISKKRYWGLALPIWVCENPDCGHFHVIGSEHELEERAIEGWEVFNGHTPHRPYIDAVKIACPRCGSKASRIPDVGNPWLDAGIVPFSTLGYRTDPEYWRRWFPADLISESFPGQFRNWFYSVLAMGTVLERRPPFLTNFSYATLLGEDGRPMHKSWGNAIDFHDGAEKIGVDVMRWMFLHHDPEQNLLFGYHRADETRRRFHIPLWNVYSFFVTYANLAPDWRPRPDGWHTPPPAITSPSTHQPTDHSPNALLDRWIVARVQQLVTTATERLEAYDAEGATDACEVFLDDLSNWYVRRSRRRFWDGEPAALDTLYYVLVTFARVLAPMIPFLAEAMYQNLVVEGQKGVAGAEPPESVHHTFWPEADLALVDPQLLADMDLARAVVSLGHADRVAANLKVRQPLSSIKVVAAGKAASIARFADLIADELNVKRVEVVEGEAELVTYRILPVNKVLGPRFGKDFPAVRAALAAADPYAVAAAVAAGQPVRLSINGQEVALAPDEVLVQAEPRPGLQITNDPQRGIVVALDTVVTPELRAEGLAREVVRRIQQMRKDAGFALSDRIHTTYATDDAELAAAIQAHAAYIQNETLSLSLIAGQPAAGAWTLAEELDGASLTLGVARAAA